MIAMKEENDRREKADYLGPYLLKQSMAFAEVCRQIQTGTISYEASKTAFNECLKDYQEHQNSTLSEVEKMLEETNAEVEKFKDFILKFKDQFTGENIENVTREGESLQRFKSALIRRLAELKKKKTVQLIDFKTEILKDNRLDKKFREEQKQE